ncbi:MAG: potassium-transporting ATPase KdpC subunit [Pseudonocardiales bacterium]|nr:potassium-transporting ATPase KdpC subunit [Pseudonocardiales bacterium]
MSIATRLPAPVRQHLAALRALLVFTVLLGIVYPLVITGIGLGIFPSQANGSLVQVNGTTVGSSLIGQPFVDANGNPLPQWFQPRPSAASDPSNSQDPGYNPLFSGASNLGPTNPKLIKNIEARRAAVAAFDGVAPQDVPPDAVTASASGLDPDISPAYAAEQINRVAGARHLPTATVAALVAAHTQGQVLGFLGEPRVDVVELNLALVPGGTS